MNNEKYSFLSWISIPIHCYLAYVINYMIDGFVRPGSDPIITGMNVFSKRMDIVFNAPFDLQTYYNNRSIIVILSAAITFILIDVIRHYTKRVMMEGKEYGTARWGSISSMRKRLSDKNPDQNVLLSENFSLMLDKKCGLNRNILVIGGSGSGKTFKFVGPNLMQANMSFVVTDPKGETVKDYASVLISENYRVRVLNVIEPDKSDGYNPFVYVKKDDDVVKLISNIMDNTTPKNITKGDPFWEKAESLFLQANFFYVLYEAENQHLPKNFRTFLMLINEAKVMEDEDVQSPLDARFEALPDGHIAKQTYHKFLSGAGDTLRSVIISAHARLFPFESEGILKIFEKDEMDLEALGEGSLVNGIRDCKTKTALFVVIPDDDKSFNFVPGMLYTQMFQALYAAARKYDRGLLPIPVQCYFDEFKNISMPENYLDIEATCRSRNIGVVPIFQDKSQMQTLYKEAAGTLIANCDTLLFLGGTDPDVRKFISESLGNQTIWKKSSSVSRGRSGSTSQSEDKMGRELMKPDEVGRMSNQDCLVLVRGEYPIKDRKLNAMKHKRANISGLKGNKYVHRKPADIQLKRMDEIGENDIILTPELIMELLETGKETFPGQEWMEKAEEFSEERQKEIEEEQRKEWEAKLPVNFDQLSLVEVIAQTSELNPDYVDQLVNAIEEGINEKDVKEYLRQGLDAEEIQRKIKIQRILKAQKAAN